jgi:hypothetical protein
MLLNKHKLCNRKQCNSIKNNLNFTIVILKKKEK